MAFLRVLKVIICFYVGLVLRANCSRLGLADTRETRSARIHGGMQASTNEFPFIVSLQLSHNHFCGGSIISSTFILTAAHCLSDITVASNVYVLAGSNDNRCNSWSSCNYARGKTVIIHPQYDDVNVVNDIALLELDRDLIIDGVTTQVAFIEGGVILTDRTTNVIVAGWGYTVGTSLPVYLMKVTLPVVPESDCSHLGMTSPNQVCAGDKQGHDSCAGDSGGPLFRKNATIFSICGLVSYGDDVCGTFTNIGVYTNTTYYLNFIQSYVAAVKIFYPPTTNTVDNNQTISSNSTANSTVTSTNTALSNTTFNSNDTLCNSTVASNCTLCNSTVTLTQTNSTNTFNLTNVTLFNITTNSTNTTITTSFQNTTIIPITVVNITTNSTGTSISTNTTNGNLTIPSNFTHYNVTNSKIIPVSSVNFVESIRGSFWSSLIIATMMEIVCGIFI